MTPRSNRDDQATINPRQQQFASWLIAILADVVVLNLFVEYVPNVVIDSFSITILTAIVLRALVAATLQLEHRVSAVFTTRPGRASTVLRWPVMWLILFGSKFVILEVIDLIFGAHVELGGFWLIIALIAAMIVVEQALQQVYDRL
jgi:hypothetical protein